MTMPNTGYAPWVLEGGEGITISQTGLHVKISATGGGTGIVAGDGLTLTGNVIELGTPDSPVANAKTIALDAAWLGIIFQQEPTTTGDGADLFIKSQETTDVNGTGGDIIVEAGAGGLNDGDIIIRVSGSNSIHLDENGTITLQAESGNGIQLNDLSGFGIELDTQGPVTIGGGASSAEHVINGLSDPAAGAVVDYWVVTWNGTTRKIAMLAEA